MIALLDRSDHAHARCVEALRAIRDPLVTVWPAVTEAMHLLGDVHAGQEYLCDMLEDEAIGIVELDAADVPRIKELMRKYRDLPMDFVDAVFVAIAERLRLNRIVSFDRHFRVYRLPRRTRFVVLPS